MILSLLILTDVKWNHRHNHNHIYIFVRETRTPDIEFVDKSIGKKIPTTETSDFLNSYFGNVGDRKFPDTGDFEETIIAGAKFEM